MKPDLSASTRPRKVAVVLNRQAGQLLKDGSVDRAVSALERKLVQPEFDATITLADGDTIREAIEAAVSSEAEIVCVGGGDGTIRTAVRAALAGGKTLFLLPLGTFNLLARDIGLPTEIEEAVELFTTGRVAEIDVGEVNGEVFACQTIIGYYPQLAQAKERMRGRHPVMKWLRLGGMGIGVLRRDPILEIATESNAGRQTFTTRMVIVSNNMLNRAELGSLPGRDDLDRHVLGLYVHDEPSPWRMAFSSAGLILGLWTKDPAVVQAACTRLRIAVKGRRRLRASIDGEIKWLEAPLEYRVRPGALKVVIR